MAPAAPPRHATGHARSLLLRGELAIMRESAAQAQGLLAHALAKLETRPADAALACNLLARLAIDTGNLPAATAFLNRAQEALRQSSLSAAVDQTLQMLAETLLLQGRREQALVHLREAAQHIERVRGSLQADRLRFSFLGSRFGVYEQLIATLLIDLSTADADAAEEAFAVAEQARSRALLDLMHGAVDLHSLDAVEADEASGVLKRVLDLRAQLNVLYSRIGELSPAQKVGENDGSAGENERIAQLESELQVAESRLAVQRTTGVGTLFAPPATAADVRGVLPPGRIECGDTRRQARQALGFAALHSTLPLPSPFFGDAFSAEGAPGCIDGRDDVPSAQPRGTVLRGFVVVVWVFCHALQRLLQAEERAHRLDLLRGRFAGEGRRDGSGPRLGGRADQARRRAG